MECELEKCQCYFVLSMEIIQTFLLFLLSYLSPLVAGVDQCRCSPQAACWPSPTDWHSLNTSVSGRLSRPVSPVAPCLAEDINLSDCQASLELLGKDPFLLQTLPGGTESTGQYY